MAIARSWFLLFFCLLLVGPPGNAVGPAGAAMSAIVPADALPSLVDSHEGGEPYVDGEVLVRFRTDNPRDSRDVKGPAMRAHARLGAVIVEDFSSLGLGGAQLVRVPENRSVEDAIAAYRDDPDVLYAEPNYLVHINGLPNDPALSEQWGLRNTGQVIEEQRGTAGADIDAALAWGRERGSNEIVVAVVDTGIDYTHPDLRANSWRNPGEVAGNRLDDDRNGYIDDVYGWDFRNMDAEPLDDNGHGTHLAGIIGAVGNNRIGGSGVMHQVRLMPLKFLGSNGRGSTASEVKAILYARAAGADIICCSFGSGLYSATERSAIEGTNALFVCAAGNTGMNTDETPEYPASFSSGNIIAVAATDNRDRLGAFSSYGKSTVDLGAPGVGIFSTLPGNEYGYMTGTSMATSMVAGAAGLVKSAYPGLSPTELRARLVKGVDPLVSLNGRVASNGRLNLGRALAAGSTGPLVPSFTASPSTGPVPCVVRFSDTSTGDPISWRWAFGDGGQSVERNPVHTYNTPGTYSVTLIVRNAAGASKTLTRAALVRVATGGSVTPTPTSGRKPYRSNAIPGLIEAEQYDLGGEGVAYHDTTPGNNGGVFRRDGVDLEKTPRDGTPHVGWIRNGEWLTYTANVARSGSYTVRARVASPNNNRKILLAVDGVKRATIAVPHTGSFAAFTTVQVPVNLMAGERVLKLSFVGDGQNLDWIDFHSISTGTTPPSSTVASFSADPLVSRRGTAVKFTVTPAPGKTVRSAWWSFDHPGHKSTWNSRSVNPTFYYPRTGTFSPYVVVTYTDGTSEVVHRAGSIRVT